MNFGQMDHVFIRRPRPDPFLTFFVRCYRRPKKLTRCLISMDALTDQDIEQIFVIDAQGRGLHWANQAPHCYRHLPEGRYVYFMDDDFKIDGTGFVGMLKDAATKHDPDIIVFRVYRVNRYLPMPSHWKRLVSGHEGPKRGRFSGDCFVVRRELWQQHIHAFGTPTAGNWSFATKLWEHTDSIHYIDKVVSRYKAKRGKGKPERRGKTQAVLQILEQRYGDQLVEVPA